MSFFRTHSSRIALAAIVAFLNAIFAPAAARAAEVTEPVASGAAPVEDGHLAISDDANPPQLISNDALASPPGPANQRFGSNSAANQVFGAASPAPSDSGSAATSTGAGATANGGGTGAPALGGQSIALPSGPGTIGGLGDSFTADLSTGTGTFSIPVSLPSARGGTEPSLALTYSSASGSGPAGMGWSTGAPYVARQVDRGIPKYDDRADHHPEQDRFLFNGSELVPLGAVHGGRVATAAGETMPPWSEGWQYFRARIEGSYFRFFWSPDHRTWRVQGGHDGTTLELGVPLDGRDDDNALETAAEGRRTRIFRWNLARSYDANGDGKPTEDAQPRPYNAVVYRYAHDGGVAYLSDIYDTSPATNPVDAPLEQYAHHTRLSWQLRPDPSSSYRRGWRIDQRWRLAHIDVTVKSFTAGPGAPRRQLRRTYFEYDAQSHVSLLTTVRLEGRCGGSEDAAEVPQEDAAESLPASTSCQRLPPLRFTYSHVQPTNPIATATGFEPLDNTLLAFSGSPSFALDVSQGVMLVDFDGDGLPDVLDGDSARNAGAHRLFLNGGHGALGPGLRVDIPTVTASDGTTGTAYDVSLKNANLAALDFDSDGQLDLVLMPRFRRPLVFSPVIDDAGARWRGRAPAWAGQPGLDLVRLRSTTRLADVNADGLIDFVVSTGSELLTYLSLAAYPGGEGAFGTATRTGQSTAVLSTEPIHACPPGGDALALFNDPRVRLADLNGDGLADIVRLRRGNVEYWPGRGDGHWGVGDLGGCLSPNVAQPFVMGNPPYPSVADGEVQLGDINGDGLADAIAAQSTAITVWLNVDGASWSAPVVVPKNIEVGTSKATVQVADVNGSGTADIVFGDAGQYRYVDLLGGQRPWLLTGIDTGLGRTTDVEFTTTTAEAARVSAAGHPWTSKVPTIAQLVKRITVHDNLDRIGRKASAYVTEYEYSDPFFDRNDRAFRGFRTVTRHSPAGPGQVGHSARLSFHLGECVDEDTPGRCAARNEDNPREGLKGLTRASEIFDDNGVFLSSSHTTYRLRRLYVGLDGREVRSVHASATDGFVYDNAPFSPQLEVVSALDVERELTPGQIVAENAPLTLRSVSGRVQMHSEATVDALGQVLEQRQFGCVAGCAAADEVITQHTTFLPVPDDRSGWLLRPTDSYITGSQTTGPRHRVLYAYDAFGRVSKTSSVLAGTVPLLRSHAGGKAVAPPPVGASVDGVVVGASVGYDSFGNATSIRGAGYRCAATGYDAAYAELPISETASVGFIGGDGCGTTPLATTATYDRGARTASVVSGPNGEISSAQYDEFGRPTKIFAPSPSVLGMVAPEPIKTYEYFLAEGRPLVGVHTRTLRESAASTGATYGDSWMFADSLGRALATFTSADPDHGDGGEWVVTGFPEFDGANRPVSMHLPVFWSGEPLMFSWAWTPSSAVSRLVYDAFGRTVSTYASDGTLASKTDYHAIAADQWDAADLTSGSVHAGTYATVVKDGHGRTVLGVQRIKQAGTLQLIDTRVSYLPSGEPTMITRSLRGSSEPPVVRWMMYDSLGRLVVNADPNTTVGFTATPPSDPSGVRTWRYAYDDAGKLVGTSDARGCGTNYLYDAGGRLVAEDRSPCTDAQDAYTAPDLASGTGAEAFYRYDQPDPDVALGATDACGGGGVSAVAGYNTSISSLGSKSVGLFDGRGRTICTSRRLAKPDATATTSVADRYAPRWYVKQYAYDAGDRLVSESTGARSPELLGSDGTSQLTIAYSRRGTIAGIGGSYGALVSSVTYDELGKPTKTVYGDLAGTTSAVSYDARHRPSLAQTVRQRPALWSGPSGSYTPPTATSEPVLQTVLEDAQIFYDEADNPIELRDNRDPSQWPEGAQPVTRKVQYDDLYRVNDMQYVYSSGGDKWKSPFAAELTAMATGDRPPSVPSPHVSFDQRVKNETFAYDWKGNLVSTQDDAHGFYDRSLGSEQHGDAAAGPYQLVSASNRDVATTRGGDLSASYDEAGNLVELVVRRDGACLPSTASCWQRFHYEWDEVGELVRARRWDLAAAERPVSATTSGSLPARAPDVELGYAYSASGTRTRKTAIDPRGLQMHDAYLFGSLELRHAQFDPASGDYELTSATESVRLVIGGASLGRVAYARHDLPALQSGRQHVFLELSDHLGSTAIVIDRDTSELVERSAYTTYGSTDSDYRPGRWDAFREPYRFTGKEDDIEVGLVYFGARYYAPTLHRFISPDPYAVHSPGQGDPNLYAYVQGRALVAIDPDGRNPLIIIVFVAVAIGLAIDGISQGVRMSEAKKNGQDLKFDPWEFILSGVIAGASAYVGGVAGYGVTGLLADTAGKTTAGIIGGAVGGGVSSLLNNGLTQSYRVFTGRGSWSSSELFFSALVGMVSGGFGSGVGTALGKAGSSLVIQNTVGGFVSGITSATGNSIVQGTTRKLSFAEILLAGLQGAVASGATTVLVLSRSVPAAGARQPLGAASEEGPIDAKSAAPEELTVRKGPVVNAPPENEPPPKPFNDEELYAAALKARDELVETFRRFFSGKELRNVATVVGGYNRETGEVTAGAKLFGDGEFCAENVVSDKLGGNLDNVVMTPTIRPSSLKIIPVCEFCQANFGPSNFGPGTTFKLVPPKLIR